MTIIKYWRTIINLHPIQIQYQLWHRLRKLWRKAVRFKYPLSIEKEAEPVSFATWIDKINSFKTNYKLGANSPLGGDNGGAYNFTFLNKSKTFKNHINWNDLENGKLWAYNLNYMDYLLQPKMNAKTGMELIDKFIQRLSQGAEGLEPYPIALRGINWIKFLSQYSILNTQYSNSLYAQYKILLDNLEYHLMANHLLEDGFSLLFGAFYFNDKQFYKKAKQIIEQELNEQILDDGAHFELSPMYHQIILDRLLDCINLIQNNLIFETQSRLLGFMKQKAIEMLQWLNTITFNNGQIPLLNDSAPDIAPTTKQLIEYAYRLHLTFDSIHSSLGSSGYQKFSSANYECIIDIGAIGPSYQPGHAHADTFNFILNVNNRPVIVDTSISTYEANKTRLKERGTAVHNTVTIEDKNSSEVWSSFRVAHRAKVKILKNQLNKVIAEHNGYKRLGTIHKREWNFSDKHIKICDTLTGKIEEGVAHFWFSPQLRPIKKGQAIEVNNVRFSFENHESISIIPTSISNGFNRFSKNYKVEISFKNHLKTIMTIN